MYIHNIYEKDQPLARINGLAKVIDTRYYRRLHTLHKTANACSESVVVYSIKPINLEIRGW